MIILLGATGYVGGAYQRFLATRGIPFRSLTRSEIDYTCPITLREFIISAQPDFLVNAAGYTGKPNVDACEIHKKECLDGNAVFPGTVRSVCEDLNLPWGHVSSGCIYTGRRPDGEGFRENDKPNFTFRQNNCSWYSGTKALGEEVLQGASNCFIWRLRIPFDNRDGPRNYLTKLMRYDNLLEAENSITNLDEFVKASWETWETKIPYGIYNITNPGNISTRQVTAWINESGVCKKDFNYFKSEEQFLKDAAKTPRSNCVMDSSKLAAEGIQMKPVEQSIKEALANWQT